MLILNNLILPLAMLSVTLAIITSASNITNDSISAISSTITTNTTTNTTITTTSEPTTGAPKPPPAVSVATTPSVVDTNSTVPSRMCATPTEDEIIDTIATTVVPVAFAAIGLSGLAGNALVVTVVLLDHQMRTTTNVLILNLAVSDLLFIVFCVPFTALDYVLVVWPFGDMWCKTVQYMIVVTVNASIYTLVLMSLDRYLAVVHPIESRAWRTEENTVIVCAVLWVAIAVLALPAWFVHGIETFAYGGKEHTSCRLLDNFDARIFHVTFFIASYMAPLFLSAGFYVAMLCRLWNTSVGGHISAESNRGRKRVTRLVVIVLIAFAGCWCPIQIILVMKSVGNFEICSYHAMLLQIASHIVAYLSASINPLLYAFLSENFRKAFRKVVYCRTNEQARLIAEHQPLPTKTTRTGSFSPEAM